MLTNLGTVPGRSLEDLEEQFLLFLKLFDDRIGFCKVMKDFFIYLSFEDRLVDDLIMWAVTKSVFFVERASMMEGPGGWEEKIENGKSQTMQP